MKKLLVLATDYSNNEGKVSLQYIHTRNIEYIKHGLDVTVLNFSAESDYHYDGIDVISMNTYLNSSDKYDLLVSHAPNLRNHYTFIKKHGEKFSKYLIFYHGHEVLRMSETYPKDYDFLNKTSKSRIMLRDIYDSLKFKVWKNFYKNNSHKTTSVFVSKWMLDMFCKNLKVSPEEIGDYEIIHNSIARFFEDNTYTPKNVEYDYVTIRSYLDGKKYGVDIVRDLALLNPNKKFLVVGNGQFFNHYSLPDNITLINKAANHEKILEYLNKSKAALLPTRTDSQGVMACEMISFGIPLITSDIPVCRDIFNGIDGVHLISNTDFDKDTLSEIDNKIIAPIKHTTKFNRVNTIDLEINLIKEI